jgi:hypothetical protein
MMYGRTGLLKPDVCDICSAGDVGTLVILTMVFRGFAHFPHADGGLVQAYSCIYK